MHTDDDEKMRLQEIFDDTGDPASIRGKLVKAFKEDDEDGNGILSVGEAIGVVDDREPGRQCGRRLRCLM